MSCTCSDTALDQAPHVAQCEVRRGFNGAGCIYLCAHIDEWPDQPECVVHSVMWEFVQL